MAAHVDKNYPEYALAEVAKHQGKQSLCVILKGRDGKLVHNVTCFQDDCPSGADLLRDAAGSDGTEAFKYAGHSADPVHKPEGLTIGVLADSHRSHGARLQTTPSVGSYSNSSRVVPGNGGIFVRLAAALTATVGGTGLLFLALRADGIKTLGREDGSEQGGDSRDAMDAFAWVGVVMLVASVLVFLAVFAHRWAVRLFPRQKDVWEYPAYFPTRKDPEM
ncbi:hypothetical protein PspLS_10160 [Pyricularia sp. CBS 133598]|nr:hypothetical protein PspLS_10160 [Pyricularia sp. CBS 133598]